jgi:hypothetical protein
MNTKQTASIDTIWVQCTKCGGKGSIVAFGNIDAGRCWGCMGAGGRTSTAREEDRKAKARARAAAKRAAAEEARVEAFVTSYMTADIAAGRTIQESHDDRCMCGGLCWTTTFPQQGQRWVALGGVL